MKRWIGWLLIAFALCSVGVLFAKERNRTVEAAKLATKVDSGHKLVVYYLYDNIRCDSCRKIEAYTREAVQQPFKTDLQIEWKPLNTDLPANTHYLKDYKLISKSVVVSEIDQLKEKRWKNLDKIWEKLDDKPAFIQYIRTEVEAYLKR
jgi:hypothetical protein